MAMVGTPPDGFAPGVFAHPTRYRTVAVRVMTDVPVAVGPFPVA